MKNLITIILLALTFNSNAQLSLTAHSSIYMEQVGDGVKFELQILIFEGEVDKMVGFTLIGDDGYVFSQCFQFNFSPHPEQLKTLEEYSMNQHKTTYADDGSLLFTFYTDLAKYVTLNCTAETIKGVDYVIIEAVNLVDDSTAKYKYRITDFKDHTGEGGKLNGGSRL